jgi:hypothetical protein
VSEKRCRPQPPIPRSPRHSRQTESCPHSRTLDDPVHPLRCHRETLAQVSGAPSAHRLHCRQRLSDRTSGEMADPRLLRDLRLPGGGRRRASGCLSHDERPSRDTGRRPRSAWRATAFYAHFGFRRLSKRRHGSSLSGWPSRHSQARFFMARSAMLPSRSSQEQWWCFRRICCSDGIASPVMRSGVIPEPSPAECVSQSAGRDPWSARQTHRATT